MHEFSGSDNSSVSTTDDDIELDTDYFSSSDEFSSDDDEDDDTDDGFGPFSTLATALIVWALKFAISHNALTVLLTILRRFGHEELPKQAKTLLKTPRTKIQVRDCPPGQSFYFGIEKNLIDYDDSYFENSPNVTIDIGIDGMTKSKSSSWEIWPVMGAFVGKNCNYITILTMCVRRLGP